ncbi:hypothetical protein TeGR_g3207, partial [Tetraparma gracilis]
MLTHHALELARLLLSVSALLHRKTGGTPRVLGALRSLAAFNKSPPSPPPSLPPLLLLLLLALAFTCLPTAAASPPGSPAPSSSAPAVIAGAALVSGLVAAAASSGVRSPPTTNMGDEPELQDDVTAAVGANEEQQEEKEVERGDEPGVSGAGNVDEVAAAAPPTSLARSSSPPGDVHGLQEAATATVRADEKKKQEEKEFERGDEPGVFGAGNVGEVAAGATPTSLARSSSPAGDVHGLQEAATATVRADEKKKQQQQQEVERGDEPGVLGAGYVDEVAAAATPTSLARSSSPAGDVHGLQEAATATVRRADKKKQQEEGQIEHGDQKIAADVQIEKLLHANPNTVMEWLMCALPKLYLGHLPPPVSEPSKNLRHAEHKFTRSVPLGTRKSAKTELLHRLTLVSSSSTTNGGVSVAFSPTPSFSAPPPHAVSGVIMLSAAPHGCTRCAMTARVETAGKGEKPSDGSATATGVETQTAAIGLQLRPEQAGAVLDDLLSLVSIMFNLCDRSDEVDVQVEKSFAEYFLATRTHPTAAENKMIERLLKFMDKPWERKAGTIMEPVSTFECITKGSKTPTARDSDDGNNMSAVWGKAQADVDAPAARVLAYLWSYMSYERCAEFYKKNAGMLRKELDVSGSHSKLCVLATKMPFSVTDRKNGSWLSWRRESEIGDFTLALAPYTDCPPNDQTRAIGDDISGLSKLVEIKIWGCYRISALAPSVCRVELVINVDMGGSIPQLAQRWSMKRVLGPVATIQDRFERNGREVDADLRSAFHQPPLLKNLNDDQTRVVQRCLVLEAESAEDSGLERAAAGATSAASQARASKGSWVKLQSSSPFVSMSMTYTKREGESSVALGMAKATLDCSAKKAFAYQFAA